MQKLQNNQIDYFCIKMKKLHSFFIDIFLPKYTVSPPSPPQSEWRYEDRKIASLKYYNVLES